MNLRVAAFLIGFVALPAAAGQTCEEKPVAAESMSRAIQLAQQVQETLDGQGARAAVLARVGSDVSEHGLRWTHAGLAYLDPAQGRWTVLHKLNHCGRADSALYRQGLANFFLDDPHEYRALVLVVQPQLQERLIAAAGDGYSAEAVNQTRYSVLAYPFSTEYQNSNGWLLEFLAEASAPVVGRQSAQDYLRATGYQPDVVHISPLKRLGATLFKANVAFFDHPTHDRLRGRFAIASVESMVRWLERRGQVQTARELTVPG